MCQHAEWYPWSSYRAKVGQTEQYWLDVNRIYFALGTSPGLQGKAYKNFVDYRLSAAASSNFFQNAVARNRLTRNSMFINGIEDRLGIRIEFRGRGKPAILKS